MTITALVALARGVLLLLEIGLAIPALYLLVVTLAAMWSTARATHAPHPIASATDDDDAWPRLAVLIPAHNEELLIGRLLDSLAQVQYPRDRLTVTVVADNCADATAAIARATGWVNTLEREDSAKRGKGRAIVWGLEQLTAQRMEYDACVLFDSDSVVDPGCLKALARVYLNGADAVQARYAVLNAFESAPTSLRWLALTLMNHVRQLGRSTLGASSTLTGNGMLFSRALLERHPWSAFGLTEDYQYYLDLVEHGERVRYTPAAVVKADMPTTFRQIQTQDIRWESDDTPVWRSTLRLLRAAAHDRSLVPVEASLELLTPPLSALVGGAVVALIAAILLRWPPTLALALVVMACVAVYVSSALVLERPPIAFYRSLAYAPMYLAWKLWVTTVAVRLPHRSREWVRTTRAAPDQ